MSDTDRARDVEVHWCLLVPSDPCRLGRQPERFSNSFGARRSAAGTFYERADEDQRLGLLQETRALGLRQREQTHTGPMSEPSQPAAVPKPEARQVAQHGRL